MHFIKSHILKVIAMLFFFGLSITSYAINPEEYVVNQQAPENFPLVSKREQKRRPDTFFSPGRLKEQHYRRLQKSFRKKHLT